MLDCLKDFNFHMIDTYIYITMVPIIIPFLFSLLVIVIIIIIIIICVTVLLSFLNYCHYIFSLDTHLLTH